MTELLRAGEVPQATDLDDREHVLKPCKVHPERVQEYPSTFQIVGDDGKLESWIQENAKADCRTLGVGDDECSYHYSTAGAFRRVPRLAVTLLGYSILLIRSAILARERWSTF